MMDKVNTDVYGLSFFLKGTRICFVTDPHIVGHKEKKYWIALGGKSLAAISKVVNDHLEAEAEERKLTPAQLAEKYQEMMGS